MPTEKLRLLLTERSWFCKKDKNGKGEDIQRGYLLTVEEREKIRKTPRKLWEQLRYKVVGSQVKTVRLGKQKEESRKDLKNQSNFHSHRIRFRCD